MNIFSPKEYYIVRRAKNKKRQITNTIKPTTNHTHLIFILLQCTRELSLLVLTRADHSFHLPAHKRRLAVELASHEVDKVALLHDDRAVSLAFARRDAS